MLNKIKNLFKDEPLEEKVPLVITKLEASLTKLDRISLVLVKEDRELFEKCVEARVRNDSIHAVMYANECVELRKMTHMLLSSKYALEQMILRLHTVMKLGDLLVTMTPVIEVVKKTRSRLVGVVPSVAQSLTEANQLLGQCMGSMGTSTGGKIADVVCGEDALRILKEADQAAENVLRERFPTIPETDPLELKSELLKT